MEACPEDKGDPVDISEVSKNTKLLIDGNPYSVDTVEFVKPGKGRGIYKLRVRSLFTGNVQDLTYHSNDKLEEASITLHEMQYLYAEGDHYVFMDNSTFEQMPMSKDVLGDRRYYLKEGTPVNVVMLEDKPIDITVPKVVEMKVLRTEASLKGATVTAQLKGAVTDTGLTVGVPAFIKEGDIIKVDTRTGNYLERSAGKG